MHLDKNLNIFIHKCSASERQFASFISKQRTPNGHGSSIVSGSLNDNDHSDYFLTIKLRASGRI